MAEGVDLRDYVDTMFAEKEKALQAALLAQEKAVAAALESSDKAITKAEANAEKWRENANEWRGAMDDRDKNLPSRREVETAMSALATRLKLLEDAGLRMAGQETAVAETTRRQEITTGQAIALAAVVVAFLGVVAVVVIAFGG
jgi:hypothetical protein